MGTCFPRMAPRLRPLLRGPSTAPCGFSPFHLLGADVLEKTPVLHFHRGPLAPPAWWRPLAAAHRDTEHLCGEMVCGDTVSMQEGDLWGQAVSVCRDDPRGTRAAVWGGAMCRTRVQLLPKCPLPPPLWAQFTGQMRCLWVPGTFLTRALWPLWTPPSSSRGSPGVAALCLCLSSSLCLLSCSLSLCLSPAGFSSVSTSPFSLAVVDVPLDLPCGAKVSVLQRHAQLRPPPPPRLSRPGPPSALVLLWLLSARWPRAGSWEPSLHGGPLVTASCLVTNRKLCPTCVAEPLGTHQILQRPRQPLCVPHRPARSRASQPAVPGCVLAVPTPALGIPSLHLWGRRGSASM